MRNLWLFLFRNRAFFWFLTFEVLSLYLVAQNNSFQGAIFLNSANQVAGNIYEKESSIRNYLNLNKVNDSLATENSRLREELHSSSYSNAAAENAVKDTAHHIQYTYTVAKVINNSISHRDNYLMLDKGSIEGISPGMGIISPMGIVGIVKDVSLHFSSAISVLHKASSFSVRLKRTKDIGSLTWDGIDYRIASLKEVPNHIELKKGDTIETSGFSLFPEGIMIGRVAKFSANNGDSFYTIDVRLNTDFNSLQYVYIVKNKLELEKKQLQLKQEDKQ